MNAPVRVPAERPRGTLVTTISRWLSVFLGMLSLFFVWDHPRTKPLPAVAVVGGYLLFLAVMTALAYRRELSRPLRILHDLVDAVAVTLGALVSGGTESPVWLLLYPHVVAVSVRGGITYAIAIGVLDAALLFVLTVLTPESPLTRLHALSLLFCGFMGGMTSSTLKAVRERLSVANTELLAANEQLSATVRAHEEARLEQDRALTLSLIHI